MTKRRVAVAATLAAGVGAGMALLAGVVLATPGSGILINEFPARAAFLDRVNLRFAIRENRDENTGGHRDHETVQVKNAEDTVMQHLMFAPNGQTGWHSHPGPAVALITAGELTLYSGDDETCTGRTFRAGEAFIDSGQGHVHLARNEGGTNAEVWVTYFDVPPGSGVRVDAADPKNCSF